MLAAAALTVSMDHYHTCLDADKDAPFIYRTTDDDFFIHYFVGHPLSVDNFNLSSYCALDV